MIHPGLLLVSIFLFWWSGDFSVSYSNRDSSLNAWNRYSRRLRVDADILFNNMKSPPHECLLAFWPLTSYSDFPTDQTFHQFQDLDTKLELHRMTSGSHWSFATGVACQQRTLTLLDTWFRLPFWGLVYAPIVETSFSELAVSFLTFSHRISRGIFLVFFYTHVSRGLTFAFRNN